MPEHPHDVLIPIADPDRAPRYIDLGARIASELESELVLLSIELDDLEDNQGITEEIEGRSPEKLRAPKAYAEDNCNVTARIRQIRARDVAEGIVVAAQAPNVGYLIMGWRGDEGEDGGASAIGRKSDGLTREADAHTIVMQESTLNEDERVLLPVLSASLNPASLAVASLLAGPADGAITVLQLSPSETTDEEKDDFRSSLLSFEDVPKNGLVSLVRGKEAFEVVFEVTSDPARTLLDALEDQNRLMLEARQAQAFKEKVHEVGASVSLPREVPCPLVLVRPKHQSVAFGL
jgi:hypothetical protein